MDEKIRRIEREADNLSPTDLRLFRHRQWRNGISLRPIPGDLVEIEGFSERTRGIFLRKAYLAQAAGRNLLAYYIKIRQNNYLFYHERERSAAPTQRLKLKLKLLEPAISLLPEISLTPKQLDRQKTLINLFIVTLFSLQYGMEIVHIINIEDLNLTVKQVFLRYADRLGLDPSRSLVFRVRGALIPDSTIVLQDQTYTASAQHHEI